MNEAKDSLRSKATLTLLDLIGEGPIGGLVNGLKSVYLNETPLENPNGTRNFQGVTADFRNGSNDQSVMPLFGNYVEAPFNVGVNVKKDLPYTFTVSNPNADAIRAIVTLPALTVTNGDNGDISGTTVQYKFAISTNGGEFIDVAAGTEWSDAANAWSLQSGYETASAPGAVGLHVTIKGATTNWETYGWIDVQAQEWTGSAWVNLSGVKRLNISYYSYGDEYGYGMVNNSETYSVQSNYSMVRFVIVGRSSNAFTIERGEVRRNNATPTITVSGKSRSRYQRAHILRITPGASSVRIRMTRITDDATSALLQNETYLDSYAEIVTLNMNYPNSALFGLRIDSQQFNQVPSRSYLIDGLYIRVPSNYDPVARSYSGVWNGSFKWAVSNNPAWVMFDVLTNSRYGLGNFISDTQVDKAMLYTIGRYCDQLVPNGLGGVEPRFVLNAVIQNLADAYKLVSDIASVFRGMGFWDGGMVQFTQDAPSDPVMLYSYANVIDGQFNYTGSARKDRHSVVHVTWNDPNDFYRQKIEYVEDPELVGQYGVKKLDTLAFGCTSRGQAARVGRWILYTEKFESDFITFKVGIDSAFVVPGNIIKIQDQSRAGRRTAGRLMSVNSLRTQAVLDAPLTISSTPATISIMLPDGTFADRTLNEGVGTHSTVNWVSPLPQTPVDNALWMVSEPNLEPILARVIGIAQGQNPSEFEITALEHNPSKFAAIEQGIRLEERNTSILDPNFVQAPVSVSVVESIYRAAPGVFANRMIVTWTGDSTTYEVAYRGVGTSNRSNWTVIRVSDGLSYEILNAAVGQYEISITGINPLGKRSATTYVNFTVQGKRTPPSDVTGFNAIANERGVELSWNAVPDEDVSRYEVRQCAVIGQSWEQATKIATVTTAVHQVPTLPTNAQYQWLVKAIDSNGNYSANATRATIAIEPPGKVTPSAAYSGTDLIVSWNAPTLGALPLKHYEVRRGETFASAQFVGTTTDTSYKIRVSWNSAQKIWVRAVDISDTSGEEGFAPIAFSAPAAVTLTKSIKAGVFTIAWSTPVGSLPIAGYEIRYGVSFESGTVAARISGLQLPVTATWQNERKYWVAAYDANENMGTPASISLIVTPPVAPIVTGSIATGELKLSWSGAEGTLPIDFYEVRRGADFDTGAVIAKVYGTTTTVTVNWEESATFHVRAVDINGVVGPSTQYISSITAPGPVTPGSSFKNGNLVLSWGAPTTGSLPIAQYEVREGATWTTGTPLGFTTDRSYSIPVTWTSVKTFWVAAINSAGAYGNAGSIEVAYSKYAAVQNLNSKIVQADAVLSWSAAQSGSLPIDFYDVRYGNDWESGEIIGRTASTTITVPITWLGARKLWVTAVDTNGQFGTSASVTVTTTVPQAPSVTSSVVVAKAELTWTTPSSTLPIKEYEIRYGAAFEVGVLVATTLTTTYRAPIDFIGDRSYWVAAKNVNGNVGAAGQSVVTVVAAPAPVVDGGFVLDEFRLEWTAVQGTLPTDQYEIRYGDSWATGTVFGRVKGTTISTKAKWLGSRTWWVAAIDVNGNVGAQASKVFTISAPSAPTVTQQVVDNNVLLYWAASTGTLPVTTYEFRRGATWETAEHIGQKAGGFTTIFETAGGTYTYLVAGIDSAGNVGAAGAVTVTVSQPPDYVLKADNDLVSTENAPAGTFVNAVRDTDGSYVLPVNTTETQQQHFTSRSWSSPDSQIAAGYPVFIQPALSPGYYEETIDYGAKIGGTKVSVTVTGSNVAGTPALRTDISVKANLGDAWIDYPDSTSAYVSNFRYVKVRVTVSGNDKSLYRLTRLNVKLDSKIKSDAGRGVATLGGAHPQGSVIHDYFDSWVPGMTMPPEGYPLNGTAAENSIVLRAGPSGNLEQMWACIDSDAGSDADGGWDGSYATIDPTKGHLFAVLMKTTANSGTSYFGTNPNGTIRTLAGATDSNPYFWSGDLPALNTWYLVVGYVHPSSYAGASVGIAGVYDMTGAKVVNGTEFKLAAGATSLMMRSYHYYNPTNSGSEVQYMARPVVIPCAAADADDKIDYLLRCATKNGGTSLFNVEFLDVTSIQASPLGTTNPPAPVCDFADTSYPIRFNVFLFDDAGNQVAGNYSWAARGY